MSQLWMVAYDITDNKIRKTVHDLLRDHGQRVQYSVFECRLTQQQLQRLRKAINHTIDNNDRIRWYPLCSWCEADVQWQGSGKVVEHNEFYIV